MNFATFERGQVAAFAFREAHHTGSYDAMRAICYVLRNRVKAGWGDGTWISVLENAHQVAATHINFEMLASGHAEGLSQNRLLQMIVRDVDDIYLGQERWDDNVRRVVCGEDPRSKSVALFYSFIDRQPRPWFVENVIRSSDHAHIGNIGALLLYR